jgi:hypothetical protein
MSGPGPIAALTTSERHFRFTLTNGHQQTGPVGPFRANFSHFAAPQKLTLCAECGNSSFFDHLGSQRNHARLDYVGLRFYSDVGFCCRWLRSSVDLNKENSVLMEYLR